MNPQPAALIGEPSLRSRLARAFTLVELLTVIAIIGLLAALLAPVLKHFSKPDVTIAATRQMLDDCARARQMAISQRSIVCMVFIQTNFWLDPFHNNSIPPSGWSSLTSFAPTMIKSTIVTQMYAGQLNGYYLESLRTIGDQPGHAAPQDLAQVKTLPAGSFISPFKFTAPVYPNATAPFPTNRPDLQIYGFLTASNIPFPTADLLTNPVFMAQIRNGRVKYVTMPYVAFNYLGQLTRVDGTPLPYDENIPLSYGTISPAVSAANKAVIQGLPNVTENPLGGSTNVSYNVIHIDHLTGRARLERLESL